MARSITVDVSVQAVESLVNRLASFDEETLVEVSTQVVNEVADRAYNLTRGRMTDGLSLTDAYVTRKMRLSLAKPGTTRPRATIVANGTLTSLGHYGARVETQPVKNRKRSKGNPAIGVPPGEKRGGVSVEVRRGNRRNLLKSFTLAGFRDNEGNPLVFVQAGGVNPRTGKPKVERLLGPSVYQLFKYQVGQIIDDVRDDLSTTLIEQAEAAFEKVMK